MPIFLAALLMALPAADAPKRVAVLEFQADKTIPVAVQAALTDEARGGVLPIAKERGLLLMTRENMLQILADMGGCDSEGECEIETFRNIGADYGVVGTVQKIEKTWFAQLKMYEASSGALLATRNVEAESVSELMRSISPAAKELAKEGLTPRLTTTVGSVDVPRVAIKSAGLSKLNIEAEKLLEKAQEVEEDKAATPAARRDAWCRLAELKGNNPYAEQAVKACAQWREFLDAKARQETALKSDYDALVGILQLKRRSDAEKHAALKQFLTVYTGSKDPRVKRARMISNRWPMSAREVRTFLSSLTVEDYNCRNILYLRPNTPFRCELPVEAKVVDEDGRRSRIDYFYDDDDRLVEEVKFLHGLKVVSTFQYDDDGRLVRSTVKFPSEDGLRITYTYDDQGRPTGHVKHNLSADGEVGRVVFESVCTYSGADRWVGCISRAPGTSFFQTETYTYDAQGRPATMQLAGSLNQQCKVLYERDRRSVECDGKDAVADVLTFDRRMRIVERREGKKVTRYEYE